MLSTKTLLEIIHSIERWSNAEIDRFAISFQIDIPADINGQPVSRARKANIILEKIKLNDAEGPFTDDIQIDSVTYILEKHIRENPALEQNEWGAQLPERTIAERFSEANTRLFNSIKRDGYTINIDRIVPLIPEELIATDTENELFRLLDHFNFNTSRGHLEQAIDNHANGNWAGANAQFRTYMESLFQEVTNYLLPQRAYTNIGDAINWLSNPTILNPVLLQTHLNEVPTTNLNYPFINGLFKRLHPTGSHPGLSDEEDCTFRYHSLIVFTRYLLSRLENR